VADAPKAAADGGRVLLSDAFKAHYFRFG